MNRITSNLWVSDIQSVCRQPTSRFDRIVTVCQDSVENNVGCSYNHFALSDGEPEGHNPGKFKYELFKEATDVVKKGLERGETVLVHCHAGANRSVSVAAAALASINNSNFDKEVWKIKQERPIANPSREIKKFGTRYIKEH